MLNQRNQRICAHSVLLYMAMTGVGLFLLPRWLPPPSPNIAQSSIAPMFTAQMRIGMEILMLSSSLFMGLPVVITAQMRRIEGPNHVLANFQLTAAAIGVLGVEFPAFFWLAISYRPDTPQDIITVFNDLSWFIIISGVSSAICQNLALGICILGDASPQKVYPRWLGFWNIWLSLAYLPGVFIPFFKTGPFTWSGILGFWVVVSGFFIWLALNYVYTLKAIAAQK